MIAVRLAPIALAALVLAAHFYRAGIVVPTVLALALVALLLVRRAWVRYTVAAGLVLGAIEWARTLAELVAMRQAMGQPWARLALILGGVAVLTAAAALLLLGRRARAWFRAPAAPRPAPRS
jgi:hypothetical protein